MIVVLNREVYQVKSGWCSRSAVLHLAAHGYSQEAADRNLERVVRLFLTPFERDGRLEDQVKALALPYHEDGKGLDVKVEG